MITRLLKPVVGAAVTSVLLALLCPLTARASSPAPDRFVWRYAGRMFRADQDSQTGAVVLDCPTVHLCVSVTTDGEVLTTKRPGRGSWRRAEIDGGRALVGVACPSARFCVAGDDDGQLLVSHDPAAGRAAWSLDPVDPGNAIEAIACPSVRLCVAADSDAAVLTSTDPEAQDATWQRGPVDDGENYECVHYGSTGTGCVQQITAIACPNVRLCTLVDAGQGAFRSTDPAEGAASWQGQGGSNNEGYYGLACPTNSFCLTATEEGWATFDPGRALAPSVAADFREFRDGHGGTIGPPTCASSTACFLPDQTAGAAGPGRPVVLEMTAADPLRTVALRVPTAVGSISCPTVRRCFASDDNGSFSTAVRDRRRSPRMRVAAGDLSSLTAPWSARPDTAYRVPSASGTTRSAPAKRS